MHLSHDFSKKKKMKISLSDYRHTGKPNHLLTNEYVGAFGPASPLFRIMDRVVSYHLVHSRRPRRPSQSAHS